MSALDRKIKFIENELIQRIIECNEDLKKQILLNKKVTATTTLDGFMSIIISIELEMR